MEGHGQAAPAVTAALTRAPFLKTAGCADPAPLSRVDTAEPSRPNGDAKVAYEPCHAPGASLPGGPPRLSPAELAG